MNLRVDMVYRNSNDVLVCEDKRKSTM